MEMAAAALRAAHESMANMVSIVPIQGADITCNVMRLRPWAAHEGMAGRLGQWRALGTAGSNSFEAFSMGAFEGAHKQGCQYRLGPCLTCKYTLSLCSRATCVLMYGLM